MLLARVTKYGSRLRSSEELYGVPCFGLQEDGSTKARLAAVVVSRSPEGPE